jgi:hypothetical protein
MVMSRFMERTGAGVVKSFIHMDAYGSDVGRAFLVRESPRLPDMDLGWIKGINLRTLATNSFDGGKICDKEYNALAASR